MNGAMKKMLDDLGLDALAREARRIPDARRRELQSEYATGGPSQDLGLFAGLALALRRVEAGGGSAVEGLRELVLAMAEQAYFCRQVEARNNDSDFWAELHREIAHIESGQAVAHDFAGVLDEFERERKLSPDPRLNGPQGEGQQRPSQPSEK